MLDGRWDIREDDIEKVKNQEDDSSLCISEFMDDKRFDIFSKTIEDKHVDQQVRPVGMYKAGG